MAGELVLEEAGELLSEGTSESDGTLVGRRRWKGSLRVGRR